MPAAAAEWQMVPSAHVGTSYADNPRLLADGDEDSSGAIGEISANLRHLTDRSELALLPRLRAARYSEDETLDSDDRFLTAKYHWLGERSQWNTELSYTRDTTLTSELGLTGLVQSNRRHQATSLTVAPEVMLTERVSGSVQMFVVDNRYDNAEFTGLVDYRYTSLSLLSTIALSDVGDSIVVTAQGGELAVSGFLTFNGFTGSLVRDATLRVGWNHQLSSLWSMNVSAGPSIVDAAAGSDDGIVFDGEIGRRGELWNFSLGAGRSQSPTGRGVLTRRDDVEFNFKRTLTERLSANIGARWIRSQDLLPQAGVARTYEVDYGRVDLGAQWRMSRDWSLSLQFTGQTQDYDLAPDRAEGFRASLSIVWNGQPRSL